MTGEECDRLFRTDIELRQYIVDQAKRHSRYVSNQEDFVQEAWVYLMLSPSGLNTETYQRVALRGIQAEYQRNRRKRTRHLEAEAMTQLEYALWRRGGMY